MAGSCMDSCLMSADQVQTLDRPRKLYVEQVGGPWVSPAGQNPQQPAAADLAEARAAGDAQMNFQPLKSSDLLETALSPEALGGSVWDAPNGKFVAFHQDALQADLSQKRSVRNKSLVDKGRLSTAEMTERITNADSIAQHAHDMMLLEKQVEMERKLGKLKAKFVSQDFDRDGILSLKEFSKHLQMRGRQVHDDEKLKKMVRNLKDIAFKKVERAECDGETASASLSNVFNPESEYANEDGISFALFAGLMLSETLGEDVDQETLQELDDLRACFIDDDHASLVAQALHMEGRELADELEEKRKEACIWRVVRRFLDPLMAGIIIMNAVTIGLSTNSEWFLWEILEYVFIFFYLMELCIKLKLSGCLEHWFGDSWAWNFFDLLCLLLGLFDAAVRVLEASSDVETGINMSNLSVVRITRLARLSRLVRLVKFFKELSLMVQGLFNGLRTMAWSMLLLLVCVYVVGVGCTQLLGQPPAPGSEEVIPYREELFSTVGRSMFTIFRCLTDGCANVDGTPLTQRLMEEYGVYFVVVYGVLVVVVTFGLFNLFMAIFVENTMTQAKYNDQKVAAARRVELLRMGRKLKMMVAKFTRAIKDNEVSKSATLMIHEHLHAYGLRKQLSSAMGWNWLIAEDEKEDESEKLLTTDSHDLSELEVPRALFEKVVMEPGVQKILDDLELSDADRLDLFDVLDADGSGALTIEEIVSGVLKVRGEARKGDVVAIRLAVGSVQNAMKQMNFSVVHTREEISRRFSMMSEQMNELQDSHDSLSDRMGRLEQGMNSLQQSVGDIRQSMGAILSALKTQHSQTAARSEPTSPKMNGVATR